jgi:tripartite-type tricarboxylate transporter receptor subunit TctC
MNVSLHRLGTSSIGAAFLVVSQLFCGNASAAWPQDQPIRLIVPQAAGGTNDIVARVIGKELTKSLGQSVIVDNRPGASGAIGIQAATQAKPDGYTLVLASDTSVTLGAVRPSLNWNFTRDLIGVAMIGDQPICIAVTAQSPYQSLAQFLDAGRKAPGTLAYGTSGIGTSQHIVGEWLAKEAGVQLVHVPYKGGGLATTDLIAGQIPAAVLGFAPLLPQHRGGKVRIVAVTSAKRNPDLPDVPTLAELGFKDIVLNQWAGIVAPRGTPPAVIEHLSGEIKKALSSKEVQKQLIDRGLNPSYLQSAQFESFLKKTSDDWTRVIPKLHLKLQ